MVSDAFPSHGNPVDPDGSAATHPPDDTTGAYEPAVTASQDAEADAPVAQEPPAFVATDHVDETTHAVEAAPDHAAETIARPDEALAVDMTSLDAWRQQAQHYADQGAAAEQVGIAETQEASGRVIKAVEGHYLVASDTLIEFNRKVAESMRTNIESTVEFWASMMGTRSLSEAVALNAQHIRKQMEALTSQGKELSGIAQKLAAQSMEPLRTSFFKAGDI